MPRWFSNLLLALALVLAVASCSGKPRIIPKSKLSKIYVEIMLSDEWVRTHFEYRTQADTMLLYEPIFNKYGYTTADYRASIAHYLADPEKFQKVFKDAAASLEKQQALNKKELEAFQDSLDRARAANDLRQRRREHADSLAGLRQWDSLWHAEPFGDSLYMEGLKPFPKPDYSINKILQK